MAKSALFYCVAWLLFCGACSRQQTVTSPYPFWGKPAYLNVAGTDSPRSIQLLKPASPDAIQGCLLIVHGMNEHIGRYGRIAEHFADRFVVLGMDLTAHGLSNPVLLKAHENIAAGATAFDASHAYLEQAQFWDIQPMRDDLASALHYLSDYCQRPLPLFILSHSLGSLVASSYLLQTENKALTDRVKGIVFSAPAFSVTKVPGWRGWFQNPIVHFSFYTHEHFLNPQDEALPVMLFNQLLALISVPLQDGVIELFSLPGMRHVFSPTAPAWVSDYLTDSEEEKQRLKNDKYMIRQTVLRYVLAIEKEIIRFRRHMHRFGIPYLLIYSEHDPITPAWGSMDFASATRSNHPDNQLVPLTGVSHHEQLFSSPPLRAHILSIIDDWLQRRLIQE